MAAVQVAPIPDFPLGPRRTFADAVAAAPAYVPRKANVRRRAAFDIGSGTTKLLVAVVDVDTSRCTDVLLTCELPVLYGVDSKRTADGCLSQEVQTQGIKVLRSLLAEVKALQAECVAAVATEVFRRAPNGASFVARVYNELGLRMCVVDQSVEAMLGFRTAAALTDIPHEDLVMWDCGGGSFQLVRTNLSGSAGKFSMHLGRLGDSVATAMLLKLQGREVANCASPNPVSLREAELLIEALEQEMPEAPEWLRGSTGVVAIGGRNSMFFLLADMIRDGLVQGDVAVGLDADGAPASCTVEPRALQAAIEAVAGCSEEELATRWCWRQSSDPAGHVLPKLCLLAASMRSFGLSAVQWRRTVGSCPGIVISEPDALGAATQ